MALLLKDNKYLKIDINGNYAIYKNKTARNKEKRATSPQEVIKKYAEMLDMYDVFKNEEQYYYDPTAFMEEHNKWLAEANSYMDHFRALDTTGNYPLMKELIPDVNNTIPTIIDRGIIGIPYECKTLEEVYTYIKNSRIFGEVDELQDA